MLVASMDHSPQEIPNDRDVWHTSALLVSVSAEQWDWDKVLGPLLNPQGKKLRKWAARRSDRYRNEFRRQFPGFLASSGVFALALSVQGKTIIDSLPELISQMDLGGNIHVSGEKTIISGLASGRNFTLPTRQAASVVYITHFICRMHALILDRLREDDGNIVWCDWQISPDNFPLGIDGPMSTLFYIIAENAAKIRLVSGNLRVSTHLSGDPGVDVCDNLAGMLRDDLTQGMCTLKCFERPTMGGMYWEIHAVGNA
ncbi:hypothetical protein ACFVTJ_15220 [Agrobacterium sp. NPDC058088]|uniref:hypothetical protein n=1 Tax=Agrobacterium sp. NPDC058088 TaxID=3346335 RepID=UPI0036D7F548